MGNTRHPKVSNLLEQARSCIDSGRYLDTAHSSERGGQRFISRPEILYVLRHGYHEKRKDQYNTHYCTWDYAIRGRTVDGRELHVVVAFDDNGMLIITAIDLEA